MADNALQIVDRSAQLARPETFAPRNIEEAIRFAEMVVASGMAPKSYIGKPPAMIVVALQFGMELGLQPMQSLQNIANINGQPSIWGDAALALVLNSPLCEYVLEDDFETIKANSKAVCRAKRRNSPKEVVRTFSYEDAKTAGIIGNAVWKTYPYRMCQMRARSFALRDAFPDVLKGLVLAEEAMDYSGPTIDSATIQTQAQTAETAQPEETVGIDGGNAFYKAYKAAGWTPTEAESWLKDTLSIEKPRNSKDIPKSKFQAAMEWANTKAPIRVKVEAAFDVLDWTLEERQKLVADMKLNWSAMHEHLSKEIDKKNSAQ